MALLCGSDKRTAVAARLALEALEDTDLEDCDLEETELLIGDDTLSTAAELRIEESDCFLGFTDGIESCDLEGLGLLITWLHQLIGAAEIDTAGDSEVKGLGHGTVERRGCVKTCS